MKQSIAISIAANIQKFTSSPIGDMLEYFSRMLNDVPRMIPMNGPTYGITFNMPVSTAMPMEALKPNLAISIRPRKFINATPIISSVTPMKYLDSRYPMSEMAFSVVFSCLSGTRAQTI